MKNHLEVKKKKEDKSKSVNNDDTKLASSEESHTDSFVELPIETELTRIGNSEIIQTDIDQNNCPNGKFFKCLTGRSTVDFLKFRTLFSFFSQIQCWLSEHEIAKGLSE